jgi:hypothetical protein
MNIVLNQTTILYTYDNMRTYIYLQIKRQLCQLTSRLINFHSSKQLFIHTNEFRVYYNYSLFFFIL